MSSSLIRSAFQACEEYFRTYAGKYDLFTLGGRAAMALAPSAGVETFSIICDSFTDGGDGFDVIPTFFELVPKCYDISPIKPLVEFEWSRLNFASVRSYSFQQAYVCIAGIFFKVTFGTPKMILDSISARKIVKSARIISGLAVQTLSAIALAGAVQLIDLGKMAAQTGFVSIQGYRPLTPLVNFGLIPTLRVFFITYLALDIIKQLDTYFSFEKPNLFKEAKEKYSLPNENINGLKVICDKKANEIFDTTRRECFFKITRDVSTIAFQSVCVLACLTVPGLITIGVVSASTGIVMSVLQTKAMRNYFNQ